MTIRAQLEDGRTLEFPDGTDIKVIKAKVRELIADAQVEPSPTFAGAAGTVPDASALKQAVIEEAPAVAGGIAGGLVAGPAGLAATAVLVGLGAAAGESYRQLGQHILGSPDAPTSSIDSSLRLGKAALLEGGGELVGGLVVKGFGKILAPFAKKVDPDTTEVISMFDEKIKPVVLLPSEATESRILDIMQNVAESSIIGGGKIADYKVARNKFFDEFADSMIDQFGKRLPPDELGELFVTSLDNKMAAFKQASSVLYNTASELAGPNIKVTTRQLKKFAKPLQAIGAELGSIEAKNAGDDLVEAIMDLEDFVSLGAAQDLRSRLLSRIDEFSVLNKKAPAIGKARKMVGLVDDAIESRLKGVGGTGTVATLESGKTIHLPEGLRILGSAVRTEDGKIFSAIHHGEAFDKMVKSVGDVDHEPGFVDSAGKFWTEADVKDIMISGKPDEALDAWRTANEFFKTGQAKWNNTFLRRLIKMADETGIGPEAIAPAVFRPGQVSKVRNVKTALGPSSREWEAMKSFFIQHLFQKSTDPEGVIRGTRMINNMVGKPGSFGLPLMNELFTKEQITALQTFGRALAASQAKQAEGLGRVAIQLTQVGALGALMTGNFEAPAATILIGPAVLSKLLLNPRSARWLTQGVQMPFPTNQQQAEAVTGLIVRLLSAAARVQHKAGKIQPDQEKQPRLQPRLPVGMGGQL